MLLQNDQPVCFPSHTLNNTEKNYAQIEKECLVIVSCMDKWHLFKHLFQKHNIRVHTDHQIISLQSTLPTAANDAMKILVFSSVEERKETLHS